MLSVVIFVIIAYSCYRNGLFSTLVMLFIIVLSAMLAVALFVPLSRVALFARMGWFTQPICYMAVFLLSLIIMQTVANYLYPPRLVLPKAVDVVGGSVLGLVNAYFLTGFLMVGLSLFPGTGGPDEKVVILNADVFFARSMEWISRRAGSADFNAEAFLRNVKKEKYYYSVRPRKDIEIRDENVVCFVQLQRLRRALEQYIDGNQEYPKDIGELKDYLRGRISAEKRERMIRCPVTNFRYRLFRPRDYQSIKGDKFYVLIYDAVGGGASHLGEGFGKRAVLFADGRVRWTTEDDLKVYLKAQREAMKKTEP